MLSIIKKIFTRNGKKYRDLSVNEFKSNFNSNSIIVDVRTPSEFETGKITGAQNINVASFEFLKEARKLDATKEILVYCKSGGRSARAANMLTKIGFENVSNLKGGIIAWQNSSETIVK